MLRVVPFIPSFPVIRKDLILVDGQVGNCKTDVSMGQQLQQLEPVGKAKGPRAVSLQVGHLGRTMFWVKHSSLYATNWWWIKHQQLSNTGQHPCFTWDQPSHAGKVSSAIRQASSRSRRTGRIQLGELHHMCSARSACIHEGVYCQSLCPGACVSCQLSWKHSRVGAACCD